MTISFALSHQIISRTDSMILASGSKNYVTAQFDLLTEDWTAPITAIFNEYTVVLDENNQCLVPWEVLANPGKVAVSAFCGDLHTAISVLVPVHPGGYIDGQTPQPPTPGVYEQLAGMAQTAVDTANDVKERADAGEFNGKDAPQIDDTQASPDHPWSGAKVDTELGKYAPLDSALTVSGIGSDMANLSPTIAWKMQGLKLFGRTTQDGTPTPDAPVPLVNAGDSGSISTKVMGKNLITLRNPVKSETDVTSGCTVDYTDNSISFTVNTSAIWHANRFYYYLPAGTYCLSAKMESDKGPTNFGIYISDTLDGTYTYKVGLTQTGDVSFTLETATYVQLRIHLNEASGTAGDTWTTRYWDIQIERGYSKTDFEPGSVQTVVASTPNGLPGIPVDSGGNYTDSTGQQWICDEIDFARGVYVQRVGGGEVPASSVFKVETLGETVRVTANIPTEWGNAGMYVYDEKDGLFSHGLYLKQFSSDTPHAYASTSLVFLYLLVSIGTTLEEIKNFLAEQAEKETPMTILYKLANPVETPIQADILAAYSALTSYNGTTNVIAQDCGVGATALANPNAYINGLIQRISALEQNAIGG